MNKALFFFLFISFHFASFSQEHLSLLKKAQKQFGNNEIPEAVSTCEQALKYAEINVGKQHQDYGDILHYLGAYLYYNGQQEEGQRQLQEAINIIYKTIGEKNDTYMQAVADQTGIYYVEGDFDKAEVNFKKLMDIKKSMGQSKDRDFAVFQGSLAATQQELGKYKESELNNLQSIHLLEDLKLEGTLDYPSALNSLATLYVLQQQ